MQQPALWCLTAVLVAGVCFAGFIYSRILVKCTRSLILDELSEFCSFCGYKFEGVSSSLCPQCRGPVIDYNRFSSPADRAAYVNAAQPYGFPRYSVKTVLIVCTTVCIFLGLVGRHEISLRTQRKILDDLIQRGVVDSYGTARSGDVSMLMLSGTTNNSNLDKLASFPRLEVLVLTRTQVTDQGMTHIAKLAHLRQLVLSGLPVTDAGLVHLQNHELRELYLDGTAISNAALDTLTSLASLKLLDIRATHITDQGIRRLIRELPKTEIAR
jgi:hypothetical protein